MNRGRIRGEQGIFLPMWALLIVAIFTMVAIVIDLGALRSDRRTNRAAADAAATAGANDLNLGFDIACDTAWGYALSNLRLNLAATSPCPAPPVAICDPSVSRSWSSTVSGYTITITNPVPDAELGGADAVGGDIPQTVNSARDGAPCKRLGVTVSYTRDSIFGRVVGTERSTTTVRSVALTTQGVNQIKPSLVILEPRGCPAISSASNGGIEVNGTSAALPGGILVVSDGTACSTSPTELVMDVGTGGSAGHITVSSPGSIYINAMSSSVCSPPACEDDQFDPTPSPYTGFNPYPEIPGIVPDRGLVDYKYNCRTNYNTSGSNPNYRVAYQRGTSGTILPACTTGEADYVNELFRAVTAGALEPVSPTVYSGGVCALPPVISGPAHIRCRMPNNFVLQVDGNVWFDDNQALDPNQLIVNGNAVLGGGIDVGTGDIVTIRGNAEIRTGSLQVSGGAFTVQGSGTGCGAAALMSSPTACVRNSSPTAAFLLLRTGAAAVRQTGGDLNLTNTTVFAAGGGACPGGSCTNGPVFDIGGGGNTNWSAPTTGPFTGLMGWSDKVTATSPAGQVTATSHTILGNGTLNLTGVFFSPTARVNLGGTGSVNPQHAQFWANALVQTGTAIFEMTPDGSFVDVPVLGGSRLIR